MKLEIHRFITTFVLYHYLRSCIYDKLMQILQIILQVKFHFISL